MIVHLHRAFLCEKYREYINVLRHNTTILLQFLSRPKPDAVVKITTKIISPASLVTLLKLLQLTQLICHNINEFGPDIVPKSTKCRIPRRRGGWSIGHDSTCYPNWRPFFQTAKLVDLHKLNITMEASHSHNTANDAIPKRYWIKSTERIDTNQFWFPTE